MDKQLAIFAALTVALWGLWGLFGKMAIDRGMSPVGIFVAEIAISAACAIGVIVVSSGGRARIFTSWNAFGLLSGLGLGVGLLFYYLSLQRAQASLVVPLTASYPLVSALLANLVLGERLRLPQWLGVLLIVLGTVLLLRGQTESSHPETNASAASPFVPTTRETD